MSYIPSCIFATLKNLRQMRLRTIQHSTLNTQHSTLPPGNHSTLNIQHSYAPSFASNITLGSITSTVCHAPLAIWHPYFASAGHRRMRCTSRYSTLRDTSCASIGIASDAAFSYVATSSYITSSNLPHKHITDSVVSSCLCIGTTVPGNIAFSIRWLVSADEVRKS